MSSFTLLLFLFLPGCLGDPSRDSLLTSACPERKKGQLGRPQAQLPSPMAATSGPALPWVLVHGFVLVGLPVPQNPWPEPASLGKTLPALAGGVRHHVSQDLITFEPQRSQDVFSIEVLPLSPFNLPCFMFSLYLQPSPAPHPLSNHQRAVGEMPPPALVSFSRACGARGPCGLLAEACTDAST